MNSEHIGSSQNTKKLLLIGTNQIERVETSETHEDCGESNTHKTLLKTKAKGNYKSLTTRFYQWKTEEEKKE